MKAMTRMRAARVRYKQALDRRCAEHGIGDVNTLMAFSGKLEIDGETFTESNVNSFPDPGIHVYDERSGEQGASANHHSSKVGYAVHHKPAPNQRGGQKVGQQASERS
jgi:hypothetical protein